jgi:thiol-disulfide isomerase/thioredoxin
MNTMAKKYKKSSEKKEALKETSKKVPMIVFFHKEGCPACIAARPAWEEFCSSNPRHELIEIESEAVPDEFSSISAFPTYVKNDENGNVMQKGSMTQLSDIIKKLKIS